MSTPIVRRSAWLAVVVAAAAAMTAAHAEEAPYAGTWALELGSCSAGQESPDAPLVIAKDRYDQHEVHCMFKSIAAKDGDYQVAGDCMVEGNAQAYDFTLTVSGDTLTFTDEAGARDFLRCK